MFDFLKRQKKAKKSKAMKEALELDYDDKERAQIEVGLKTASDFFSPYSVLTYQLMHPGVVEYIEACEAVIPASDDLSIDIYTEEPTTSEEKRRIRKAVKRHNAEKIVALNKQLHRKALIGSIYIILGLIVLMLDIIFDLGKITGINTFFEVILWIFIWDGVEKVFMEGSNIANKRGSCYRLLNAKVHVKKYPITVQKEFAIGDYEDADEDE